MHQKTKKKDKNGDVIIRAVVAGIVAAVILLLAYSLMIDKGVASIKYVGYAVIGINFIAAAVCGIVAGSAAGEGRLVKVTASCGIFTAALAVFALASNDGGVEMDRILRMILCGCGGALCGLIVRFGKSNKKLQNRSKNKRRYNKS